MARDTTRGLHVWDVGTDQFDHDELAANWDRLEELISQGAQSVETLSAIPVTNLFAGRLIMLSVDNGGYRAYTMLRYNGSTWHPVGPLEILPTIPVSGNFAGRVVILSSADGSFAEWDIIRYDGSDWGIVGGWATVNTGGGASNIDGMETAGDIYISSGARGLVLTDRSTGVKRRIFLNNGLLQLEVVS